MGKGYCRMLEKVENAKLVAVCDVNENNVEEVCKQFNVTGFTNHKKLIASGLCDVVCIVTPHPIHYEPAYDCINAGLHVVCEKPLTERISTAETLVKAAKAKKVTFVVMFQRRFDPVIKKAHELIAKGAIGEIYRATLFDLQYRTQAYYDSGKWRATWKGEGGGVLMNQSPHMIDLLIYLTGMPSEVYGKTETRFHKIEVEDHAEAMLKFPNGGTGYIYCSTCEPAPGSMIEICGEKGKLIYRNEKLTMLRFTPGIRQHIENTKEGWSFPSVTEIPLHLQWEMPAHTDYEAPQTPSTSPYSHADVLNNVVRHILFNEKLITPAESGLYSLELANAITLSSFKNKWIKLPISRGEYDALLNKLQKKSKFIKKQVVEKSETDPRLLK